MAQDIVGGLFGITPEMYQQNVGENILQQGVQMGQLAPDAFGRANVYAGAAQLGRGVMGAQDPQLRLISARNAVIQGIDLSNPEALQAASSRLAQIGDMQGAYGLSELAQKRAESSSAINLREAQALKASMMPKLTGDERYIAQLRSVENTLRQGKTPSDDDLSTANIASQMLSKPRSFFDQASGQTVVIPATDPSKAFPLTFKKFGGTQEQAPAPTEGATTTLSTTATRPSMPTTGTATVQQVTRGNLPAGVIQDVAGIDKQLKEIENRAPQLDKFLSKIENGEVKYNLATNAYDIVGSIAPPIWGGKEIGKQIDKDEIQRALTARVNSVLNAAKGVQAKDDAQRAKDQIASPSTFLSSERMAGAIKDLQRAEKSLAEELSIEKQTLQSKGQPIAPTTPPSPKGKSGELSREEKINIFIRKNNGKPTKQEAEAFLSSKGLL